MTDCMSHMTDCMSHMTDCVSVWAIARLIVHMYMFVLNDFSYMYMYVHVLYAMSHLTYITNFY